MLTLTSDVNDYFVQCTIFISLMQYGLFSGLFEASCLRLKCQRA